MRPHLWLWWAEIAIEQERLAREARANAATITVRGEGFIDALVAETRASLICVSAAAHVLDALFGVVASMIEPRRTGTRWSTLLATFKDAFHVRGLAGAGGWATEFEWLAEMRDSAVHHEEETRESMPHPTGTNTSWANVAYSLEAAERAVNLMLEVLDTAVGQPCEPFVAWARDNQRVVQELHERRADGRSATD